MLWRLTNCRIIIIIIIISGSAGTDVLRHVTWMTSVEWPSLSAI